MALYKATDRSKVGKGGHVFQINILSYFDEGYWYWVAPSLDLVGAGESEEQAERSFNIVLEEFIKYTSHKKTIFQELEKLGWHITQPVENKNRTLVEAPGMEDLKKNPAFSDIWNKNPKISSKFLELAL